MSETLRKAAEGLPEMLLVASRWIGACPFENALTHEAELIQRSVRLQVALAEPEPVTPESMLSQQVVALREDNERLRAEIKRLKTPENQQTDGEVLVGDCAVCGCLMIVEDEE